MSLCLLQYHDTKAYGEMEVKPHSFLTLAPEGSEWPASPPRHIFFILGEGAACTYTDRVGSLGDLEKR